MANGFLTALSGSQNKPPALPEVTDLRTTHKRFMGYIFNVDDFEFNAALAQKLFSEDLRLSKCGGPIVLSDEQFYCSPWDGCALRKRNCDRIASVFSDAHIVIVLRNQPDQ